MEKSISLLGQLKEEFDYILIDCPAGIEQGFKNAIAGADRAIVVTTAEISSIRDADRIIGLLESSDIKNSSEQSNPPCSPLIYRIGVEHKLLVENNC